MILILGTFAMACFPFYMHVYTLIYIYVNRGIFDFFIFVKDTKI